MWDILKIPVVFLVVIFVLYILHLLWGKPGTKHLHPRITVDNATGNQNRSREDIMQTQENITKAIAAAEALQSALQDLNRSASKDESHAGRLLHMLVIPQLQAADLIRAQMQQIDCCYSDPE